MESKKYTLNRADLLKVVEVVWWHGASAVVAALIMVVADLDLGAYAFLLPMVNAGLYAIKRFVDGRKAE